LEVVPVATSTGLTPAEKKLRASGAAHTGWANTEDRTKRTQPGRDAFRESFKDKIDPERKLPPSELAKRAENAFKAHMAGLAFKSARARRKTNAAPKGDVANHPDHGRHNHDLRAG